MNVKTRAKEAENTHTKDLEVKKLKLFPIEFMTEDGAGVGWSGCRPRRACKGCRRHMEASLEILQNQAAIDSFGARSGGRIRATTLSCFRNDFGLF